MRLLGRPIAVSSGRASVFTAACNFALRANRAAHPSVTIIISVVSEVIPRARHLIARRLLKLGFEFGDSQAHEPSSG